MSDSPTSARVSAPPSGAFLCLVTGKAVVIVFSVDDKMQCYYLKKKTLIVSQNLFVTLKVKM